jgi:hypothetical protein
MAGIQRKYWIFTGAGEHNQDQFAAEYKEAEKCKYVARSLPTNKYGRNGLSSYLLSISQ